MEVFKDVPSLIKYINDLKSKGKSIGLVPTMGYLHQGHLTLVDRSARENDVTVCSVFVNPTQFNNPEDLKNYPRSEERDMKLLKKCECDVVFIPEVTDIYQENRVLNFSFGYLENIMEGKYRPDHFKGVGLIVAKLFNIVQPTRAYFGTKDLQQLVLIQRLVEELNYRIEICPVETVREKSGLAMSSRNARLSSTEKEQALIIYSCLQRAKNRYQENVPTDKLKQEIFEVCQKSNYFTLEYFEIVNRESLLPIVNNERPTHVSACMAGYIGKVRLIDNISII